MLCIHHQVYINFYSFTEVKMVWLRMIPVNSSCSRISRYRITIYKCNRLRSWITRVYKEVRRRGGRVCDVYDRERRKQRTYRHIRNNIMICFSTQIGLMHRVADKLLTRGTAFCHARNVIANVLCSVELSLINSWCCHGNRPTFSY